MEVWEVDLALQGLIERGLVSEDQLNGLPPHEAPLNDPEVTPDWIASLPAN